MIALILRVRMNDCHEHIMEIRGIFFETNIDHDAKDIEMKKKRRKLKMHMRIFFYSEHFAARNYQEPLPVVH